VEMNLAWNLTERERLTPYCDSAEVLGRLAGNTKIFEEKNYIAFLLVLRPNYMQQ